MRFLQFIIIYIIKKIQMDYVNDFFHKKTGINAFRPRVQARRDLFFEYLPTEEAKDNEVLRRLCK